MLDVKKLERLINIVKNRRKLYADAQVKFQEAVSDVGYQGEQFQTADNRLRAYIMELSGQQTENIKSGKNGESKEGDTSGSGASQEES